MPIDFLNETELSGDSVTQEQVDRLCHRYYWASAHCHNKDVLEVACGTGQGAGFLSSMAKSYQAGDYSDKILERARHHYGARIDFKQFDAQELPFPDRSFDVVIMFEAIYYIPSADNFVAECRRVLRPGGKVLIATANKDLYDFNPSPHSTTYFGVTEMENLFNAHGFITEFFGSTPIAKVSWRQRITRPLKKIVVSLGFMPKSKTGKQVLKRLVFGRLVTLPAEITGKMTLYNEPACLPASAPDRLYKVIYCVASLY